MPPVSPQGSRGGLITAVVVFTIGFVMATIFAIYYGVALSKEEEQYKTLNDKSKKYFIDTNSARVIALTQEAANNPSLRERTVLAAAIQDSADLAEKMVGKDNMSATTPADAVQKADAALMAASAKLNSINLPSDLVGAIGKLTELAAGSQQQVADLRKTQDGAATDAAIKIQHAEELVQKAQQDEQAANDLKQAAMDAVQKANADYEKKLATNNHTIDIERDQFNKTLAVSENKIADLKQQMASKDRDLAKMTEKLAGRRVPVEDSVIRLADGRILSVASDDVAYINLGSGDHIVPGMTFEVYDKHDGIPKLGDGMAADNMPAGLGSVEVKRVDSASSQVQVRLEPNMHIVEGDLIANLVYDRNVKFKFVVYGKFDFAQTNHPNDGDRDKIVALIKHWGGNLQKEITVDTDFVVMGSEPQVEDFTQDQLQDPFYARRKDDEEADQKAYDEVLAKARALTIPVMNQNRFLYFVGYYTDAQR